MDDPGRSDDGAVVDLEARVGPRRVSVAFVVAAIVDLDTLDGGWRSGPLPIRQPSNATTRRRGHRPSTDEEARRTLVAPQQADALYGRAGLARRHLIFEQGDVLAAEVLAERETPDGFTPCSFLVVHAAGPGENEAFDLQVAWLSDLRKGRRSPAWSEVVKVLGPGIDVSERPFGIRTNLFIDSRGVEGEIAPLLLSYALLTGSSMSKGRDLHDRAHRHQLTIERPDWSALVLRDGGAFVAHQESEENFGPTLRSLVHSVHTDALLLSLIQRAWIDRSGARAVDASLTKPEDLLDLEREHFEFRRQYWRTFLTDKRTAPPDIVLHQFQKELLTIADIADVEDRVNDGARLAMSLYSREHQWAQDRLNRNVQTGSVVIGAFALAFTGAPVIAEPGGRLFLLALLAGAIAVVISFVLLELTGRRPPRSDHGRR